MKKLVNFIFIFALAMVLSPLKSMADCHSDYAQKDDCHKCHDEKSEEKSEDSKKTERDGCAMACCHMALSKITSVQLVSIDQVSHNIIVPVHISGAIRKHSEELFRPPIA